MGTSLGCPGTAAVMGADHRRRIVRRGRLAEAQHLVVGVVHGAGQIRAVLHHWAICGLKFDVGIDASR